MSLQRLKDEVVTIEGPKFWQNSNFLAIVLHKLFLL